MITLDPALEIFIYHHHVDMRKSIDGLVVLVVESMQLDPSAKAMYLFRNRASDKFKAILWDGDGFILLYKRKEQGRFVFPKEIVDDYYSIDADLFNWLLKGFDFYHLKHHPKLKISKYY